MNKFIKLPLIERWTYCSKPSDSRPVLSENGILINLDAVSKVEQVSDFHTVIDGSSIPCSLERIQMAWKDFSRPISSYPPDEPPIPYDPWWEGKFDHQR